MSNFRIIKQILADGLEHYGLEEDETITEEENQTDKICLEVPLFIRLLEFSREDAADDVALHVVAENAEKLMKKSEVLNMSDYDAIISGAKIKQNEEE